METYLPKVEDAESLCRSLAKVVQEEENDSMREGAALIDETTLCAACNHPYAPDHFVAGQNYLCSGCPVGKACRAFVPPDDAPEAAGATDAVARIIKDDVELYAIASYLYYKYDVSIITDTEFDACTARLLEAEAWKFKEHSWLDKNLLTCGSGFDLSIIPLKKYQKRLDKELKKIL